MAITKNYQKVREFCKEVRDECVDIIKKNTSIEDILGNPEAAMITGKCFEMYDKAADLMKEQAKQLDEMSELLEASYKTIQKMEETINDLRKEVNGAH